MKLVLLVLACVCSGCATPDVTGPVTSVTHPDGVVGTVTVPSFCFSQDSVLARLAGFPPCPPTKGQT